MQSKVIKNIFKVSLSWIAARRSKHSLAFLNIQTLFWNESYGDSLFWKLGQSFESWAWITKLLRMCPERVKGNAGVSALPLWSVGSPFSIAGRVIQNDHPKSFYIWRLLLYFLHKYQYFRYFEYWNHFDQTVKAVLLGETRKLWEVRVRLRLCALLPVLCCSWAILPLLFLHQVRIDLTSNGAAFTTFCLVYFLGFAK